MSEAWEAVVRQFSGTPYVLERVPPVSRWDALLQRLGLREARYEKIAWKPGMPPTLVFSDVIEYWSVPTGEPW